MSNYFSKLAEEVTQDLTVLNNINKSNDGKGFIKMTTLDKASWLEENLDESCSVTDATDIVRDCFKNDCPTCKDTDPEGRGARHTGSSCPDCEK